MEEIGLRPDVDKRLQVAAVVVGLFVAKLNAYEHNLMRLVAWFLGYYLGDPVLDWIIRVPHLIESAMKLPKHSRGSNMPLDEFCEAQYLTNEDCKVFLRIMYPRCRNVLHHQVWHMQIAKDGEPKEAWVDHGAAEVYYSGVAWRIVGCRRRCGECAQNHPLRLLQVLEKHMDVERLRRLYPYVAHSLRMPPPKQYLEVLRSIARSGYAGKYGVCYGVDWYRAFKKACMAGDYQHVVNAMCNHVPITLRIEEYNRASHRHQVGPKQRANIGKFWCRTNWIVESERRMLTKWCVCPEHPLEVAVYLSNTRKKSVGIFVPKAWEEGAVYDHVYRLPQ